MHVKTYTGKTTSAVLANIKADLGPDAVILDTRETKVNGKAEIVITAAVERGAVAQEAAVAGYGFVQEPFGAPSSFASSLLPSGTGWKTWQEEWGAIKGHLLSLMKPELQFARLSPRQRVAMEFLEREGVEPTALLSVFEALLPDPEASILAPLGRLVTVKPWGGENWPERVHLVTGPFGVGKTTALVRLALILRKKKPGTKIWVVNADSRRGGGRLLLKNYAQLCGLEYKEAANAVEFASILGEARTGNVDSILVDLPGLPRGKSMPEMLDWFGMTDPNNALHLVVTPQYGSEGIQSLVARYVPKGHTRTSLIWTKLDEAENFGTLVNVGAASRMPVSALSSGPELNDTLVEADETALWRLLFKQEMPCAAHPDSVGF